LTFHDNEVESLTGLLIVVKDGSTNKFDYGVLGFKSDYTLISPDGILTGHAPDQHRIFLLQVAYRQTRGVNLKQGTLLLQRVEKHVGYDDCLHRFASPISVDDFCAISIARPPDSPRRKRMSR
jgi:hypothetical protein